MTREYKTDQELFWAGEFGTNYISRNAGDDLLASNLNFFSKALSRIVKPRTCIEFGANIGMNLKALKILYPGISLHGIEINSAAAAQLGTVIPPECVFNESILDFIPSQKYDLVLIKGVLIHVNPEKLHLVYERLVDSCGRYLLLTEYYNPVPVSVTYRGYSDRLFKRDFAGEMIEKYATLKLIDYGFLYRRDPSFPQDDANWFLMENRERLDF